MSMRRSHLSLLIAALAVTASAGCGGATTNTAGSGSASSATPAAAPVKLSSQDRSWLRKIHQGGIAESHVARLAQSRAESAEVKALGETLVSERAKLDEALVQNAQKLGVTLPSTLSEVQRKEAEQLAEAQRGAFDRRFVTELVQSHEQAIAATRRQIKKGSAPEVVTLAKNTLPSLRSHLDMLRKAAES
jgi:putative membrane protein